MQIDSQYVSKWLENNVRNRESEVVGLCAKV